MKPKFQIFVPPQGYVAQRWEEGSSMPPLGVLFLAAVLEREGYDVEVVPADVLRLSWNEIAKKIDDFKPDIVGITTTTENRFESFKLARIAKETNPKIMTLLGGPHISMAREDTIKHRKEVDIVSIGEGENTIIELAKSLETGDSLEKVKGLIFRDEENEIIFTGERPKIDNLDTLPLPARHLIPMEKYNFYMETRDGRKRKAQNIMTSRGCPFNCYFCATPINWGRRVRGHSVERVIEEIEFLIEHYGAEFIWFYDDTLNYNPKRLHKLMDIIIERKYDIKFANEFRIDAIDKPLLEKMKRAGLEIGYFGIEAGASRVRRNIVKKNFEIEKAYQFLKWSRELDFIPGPFFIFSHHTETWEEAKETIDIIGKVKDINPNADISVAILHIYPGTPLEFIAKEEGILPKDFSWSKEEDMKRVETLPAAQGDVPLFKDKLSWWQIADLVFRWSSVSKKTISKSKIIKALKSIRGLKDIWVYTIFFLTLMKYKIINLFKKKD